MKSIITAMAVLCMAVNSFAQNDSSRNDVESDTIIISNDTIRVGNMIIIRNGSDRGRSFFDSTSRQFRTDNPNLITNWFVVDIGFNQMNDKTNYAQSIANGYLAAGANEDWFNQHNFKSTNVNLWVFIQRLNMIKHVVNLKYGLGFEWYNFKYTENIKFQKTDKPLVIMDNVDYRKNKLAADYITVPLMLNFNFTPNGRHAFGFSAGVSGGYLYSSRQKLVGGTLGKKKYRDDYDLRKFKVSYVGEIALGPVLLYGSYATKSMFEHALDQTPYNFGLRLSNW